VTDEGPAWGTTKTIATVRDAVEQAMAKEKGPSIVEAKVPLKLVVSLCLFLLTQALTVAGLYFGVTSDIRSLQEAQENLQSLADAADVDAVRTKIDGLHETVLEIETEMRQPPTNLDHLRVIGDIKADLRLIDQRVQWLENNR
jgi:hypothetical protein